MNTLLLLADAGGSGQIEQIARTFGVDWSHLISQIISFCIVCALLYKFAYSPVLTMLDKRRQGIAEAQKNAEKIKAELAQTESHRQEVIMQANEQATKLMEEARNAASRVGDQETRNAIAAAEQILMKAREAAAQEHERMLAELKREIGRLVLETTAAVSGKVLTADDQQALGQGNGESINCVRKLLELTRHETNATKPTRRQTAAWTLSHGRRAGRESGTPGCAVGKQN